MKDSIPQFPFLFSGRIGDIVGRIVNGKQVIAKRPGPRKGKPTTRQLQVQNNFSLVFKFLRPIIPLFRAKYNEPGRTGFNKAQSYVLRHALLNTQPFQRIDYSKVVLGEGLLPNPKQYRVDSYAKGLLEFNWSMESRKMTSKTDRIFVAAYCEELNMWTYILDGPERREGEYLMDVALFSGKTLEVYFGFASAGSIISSFFNPLVSTSIYAGSINVR
jgi:hypothetical protein